MPATFGGVAIFGIAVKMSPNIAPRAGQEIEYAGITGIEHLDLGGRGRVTSIRGILSSVDIPTLFAAKTQLESFHDGVPRVLVDTWGQTWANVLLGSPQFPEGYRSAGARGFYIAYTLELRHLSQV